MQMNVFELRDRVLDDYHRYVESFLSVKDDRIREICQLRAFSWSPMARSIGST